jgi:hypothetical protein
MMDDKLPPLVTTVLEIFSGKPVEVRIIGDGMDDKSSEKWRKYMRKKHGQRPFADAIMFPDSGIDLEPLAKKPKSNTLYHGTSKEAALDIYDNCRVLLGVGNRFWMSSHECWARRYGLRRVRSKVHIVEFMVVDYDALEYAHVLAWTMFEKDGVPGRYYPLRGAVPVSVRDEVGQIIRTSSTEGG